MWTQQSAINCRARALDCELCRAEAMTATPWRLGESGLLECVVGFVTNLSIIDHIILCENISHSQAPKARKKSLKEWPGFPEVLTTQNSQRIQYPWNVDHFCRCLNMGLSAWLWISVFEDAGLKITAPKTGIDKIVLSCYSWTSYWHCSCSIISL